MDTHEELRDELIAVLGATRELSPETDEALAEAYLTRVEREFVAPSRVGACRRKKREPLTVLRYGLMQLLVILFVAPIAVFLITFPADGVLQHIDAGAIPPLYYAALLLVAATTLVTAYLERYTVQVRVSQRKRVGTTLPRP